LSKIVRYDTLKGEAVPMSRNYSKRHNAKTVCDQKTLAGSRRPIAYGYGRYIVYRAWKWIIHVFWITLSNRSLPHRAGRRWSRWDRSISGGVWHTPRVQSPSVTQSHRLA